MQGVPVSSVHGNQVSSTYTIVSILHLGFLVLWFEAVHIPVRQSSAQYLEVLLCIEENATGHGDAGHPRQHSRKRLHCCKLIWLGAAGQWYDAARNAARNERKSVYDTKLISGSMAEHSIQSGQTHRQ